MAWYHITKVFFLDNCKTSGKAEVISVLVKDPWANINATDGDGNTPLHLAISKGTYNQILFINVKQEAILTFLLEQPVVNNTSVHIGQTCFFFKTTYQR